MATALINPYDKYTGNGAATEFAVSFPYLDRSFVSVYLKRYGGDEEKLTTDDYEFVSDAVIKFPKTGSALAVLGVNDKLVIQRETPAENEYVFENQKRLFPIDVMNADDKAYQILQEKQAEIDRAIKVTPTSDVNPADLVSVIEIVYAHLDEILNLAYKQDQIQYAVMPEAASTLAGQIYQYTGNTDASFTNGHFYKCVLSGSSYVWAPCPVMDAQTVSNLVTSISAASTDSQYPSAKCVYDLIGDVETLLSQV